MNVDIVFTSSETLFPHYRDTISKALNCKVVDHYGLGEPGTFASGECCERNIRFSSDISYLEVVNSNGKSVDEGQNGEIVETCLHNFSMPFIRYKTNDYGKIGKNNCGCNSVFPVINNLEGRVEDMIINSAGASVPPAPLTLSYEYILSIDKCQFLQNSDGDLTVKIVPKSNFNNKDWNNYKGSSFSNKEIKKTLKKNNLKILKTKDIFEYTSKKLKLGKVIAWFQGSAEFGPRALGNRSILAKPYPSTMKDYINNNVKFRENFRPLAPAVLKEKSKIYFQLNQNEIPHMLQAIKVKKTAYKRIPAIIHKDGTARVQTVTKELNEKFWKLLNEFEKITGCPVLINTSFNVKGQPIVNSPIDAVNCFLSTKIDYLCIGSFLVKKK